MTTPTADAPTVAGARRTTTRRQNEAALLDAIAQGRHFGLVHSNGLTYITEIPSGRDAEILRSASGMALLASLTPPLQK